MNTVLKLMIMRLHILPNRLISDIQQDFNLEFPFLRLEFFDRLGSRSENAGHVVPGNRKISDVQPMPMEGVIAITSEMKVNDLVKRLKSEFGLTTKILRKSGNLWMETTMTDQWTLGQQNNHGEEISTVLKTKESGLNRDSDY